MARKNPTMPKRIQGEESTIPGIELPNATGISSSNLEKGNAMPDVSMTKHDGDQKDVATPPFANGKDIREYRKVGGADPTPAKAGA